jgi:hypothetical protein
LLLHCDLTIGEELFTALIEKNERVKPKDEDIQKHMRKGEPGEYKEKLKQETVKYLNVKFSSMLLNFGYKLDGIH